MLGEAGVTAFDEGGIDHEQDIDSKQDEPSMVTSHVQSPGQLHATPYNVNSPYDFNQALSGLLPIDTVISNEDASRNEHGTGLNLPTALLPSPGELVASASYPKITIEDLHPNSIARGDKFNPYKRRADEIGPSLRFPGTSDWVGNMLPPPGYVAGEIPYSPEKVKELYFWAREQAVERLNKDIEGIDQLPEHSRNEKRTMLVCAWNAKFERDRFIHNERLRIHHEFALKELKKHKEYEECPSLEASDHHHPHTPQVDIVLDPLLWFDNDMHQNLPKAFPYRIDPSTNAQSNGMQPGDNDFTEASKANVNNVCDPDWVAKTMRTVYAQRFTELGINAPSFQTNSEPVGAPEYPSEYPSSTMNSWESWRKSEGLPTETDQYLKMTAEEKAIKMKEMKEMKEMKKQKPKRKSRTKATPKEKKPVWYHEELKGANLPTSVITPEAYAAGERWAKEQNEKLSQKLQAPATKKRRRGEPLPKLDSGKEGVKISMETAQDLLNRGLVNLNPSGSPPMTSESIVPTQPRLKLKFKKCRAVAALQNMNGELDNPSDSGAAGHSHT
ncbi:MAG: hypothetical protein M1834_003500 [Cirrosporium novae-zelandiae]|nr:MAG: hypothetical protein M1834_003500 [Cirrosporium novae-zelandiae]